MPVKTHITMDGPLFKRDPSKPLRENIHDMMLDIARGGAKDVRAGMRVGQGGREPIRLLGDHVSQHVYGELRRYPPGAPYSARVIVRNRGFTKPEGKSLMAAASSVETQTHAVRRTTGRIMRSRVLRADLTKGLG